MSVRFVGRVFIGSYGVLWFPQWFPRVFRGLSLNPKPYCLSGNQKGSGKALMRLLGVLQRGCMVFCGFACGCHMVLKRFRRCFMDFYRVFLKFRKVVIGVCDKGCYSAS